MENQTNLSSTAFGRELTALLEKHQVDDHAKLPAYLLMDYIMKSIAALGMTLEARDAYYDETEVKIESLADFIK